MGDGHQSMDLHYGMAYHNPKKTMFWPWHIGFFGGTKIWILPPNMVI
jgi:hypothetical protein